MRRKDCASRSDIDWSPDRWLRLFLATAIAVMAHLVTTTATPRPPPDQQSRSLRQPSLHAADIKRAREQLTNLSYWLLPDAIGVDSSLRHALIAFQKIEGRKPTGALTTDEVQAIFNAQSPKPLETGYPHIEIDLERQVLFFVESRSADLRILPVSSGNGELFTEGGVTRRAVTPIGRFTVYRKIEGWRKSPLGSLYYPSYIVGGVAIHGNRTVPVFPASHGCIRVPMFAAKELSELMDIGLPVIVHDGTPAVPTIR